ncbi:MAG: hypothetical protein EOO07_31870, partial [Chitinophagaceae bacterium]
MAKQLTNLFATQDQVDALLALQASGLDEKQARPYKQVSKSIANLVKKEADCKTLGAYYGEAYDAHKNDTLWLQVAAIRLAESGCTGDASFLKISETAHSLKPTAKTAYGLGVAYQRTGKNDLAARYLEESAELETNKMEKANRYFVLASSIYKGKDNAKAKANALKALGVDKTMGKAWLFLAQLYASGGKNCAANDFEKKALNLLAAETALKAGVA